MRKIRVQFTIPTANITPISPGVYRFVLQPETLAGTPLNHPNIPNNTLYEGPVYSTSGPNSIFRVDIETTLTTSQSVSTFQVVVYRSNTSSGCEDSAQHSITGTVNCDLSQSSAPVFRVLSGQKQLRVYLYSARPAINPFTYRIYNSSNVLVQTITGINDSTQYVNISNALANGNYTVTAEDKDGCMTGSASFTILVTPTCSKENLVEFWWRAASAGPPRVPFADHFAASLGACNGSGAGSNAYFETGIGVGNEVWLSTSPSNCDTLPDGYYYFRDPSQPFNPIVLNTARIQGGVITEVQPFVCGGDPLGDNSDMTLIVEP